MTHLNGHLKLFMLLLELLCLCQAARDGEAGHQHGLRVLDPSHHLEMKHERPPKRKTKSIFTCVASAWKVASWTHCSSLIRRIVARSSMSTARSWGSSTLKDKICLIFKNHFCQNHFGKILIIAIIWPIPIQSYHWSVWRGQKQSWTLLLLDFLLWSLHRSPLLSNGVLSTDRVQCSFPRLESLSPSQRHRVEKNYFRDLALGRWCQDLEALLHGKTLAAGFAFARFFFYGSSFPFAFHSLRLRTSCSWILPAFVTLCSNVKKTFLDHVYCMFCSPLYPWLIFLPWLTLLSLIRDLERPR